MKIMRLEITLDIGKSDGEAVLVTRERQGGANKHQGVRSQEHGRKPLRQIPMPRMDSVETRKVVHNIKADEWKPRQDGRAIEPIVHKEHEAKRKHGRRDNGMGKPHNKMAGAEAKNRLCQDEGDEKDARRRPDRNRKASEQQGRARIQDIFLFRSHGPPAQRLNEQKRLQRVCKGPACAEQMEPGGDAEEQLCSPVSIAGKWKRRHTVQFATRFDRNRRSAK